MRRLAPLHRAFTSHDFPVCRRYLNQFPPEPPFRQVAAATIDILCEIVKTRLDVTAFLDDIRNYLSESMLANRRCYAVGRCPPRRGIAGDGSTAPDDGVTG